MGAMTYVTLFSERAEYRGPSYYGTGQHRLDVERWEEFVHDENEIFFMMKSYTQETCLPVHAVESGHFKFGDGEYYIIFNINTLYDLRLERRFP